MEVPRLEREVWSRFRKESIVLVGVAVDQSREEASAFRDRYGLTFPVWVDHNRLLYARFARQRLPVFTVILTPDGRVAYSSPELLLPDVTGHLARLTRKLNARSHLTGAPV